MTPKPLSRAEQVRLDREKLSLFIRHIKHYKCVWGLPPDKVAFRNAWMAAKSNVEVSHGPT
jgi:hypothetical protein